MLSREGSARRRRGASMSMLPAFLRVEQGCGDSASSKGKEGRRHEPGSTRGRRSTRRRGRSGAARVGFLCGIPSILARRRSSSAPPHGNGPKRSAESQIGRSWWPPRKRVEVAIGRYLLVSERRAALGAGRPEFDRAVWWRYDLGFRRYCGAYSKDLPSDLEPESDCRREEARVSPPPSL
jgi:hypothetical protein